MRAAVGSVVVVFAMVMATGCATAPHSEAQRRSLVSAARASLDMMVAQDPSLQDVVDRSAGYAVFPDVGAAGAVIGGAYGRGVVFEGGRPTGFTELNQGSVGALLGAQTYSELVVFHDENALGGFKAGDFDLGAEASAVLLKAGAAAATRLEDGFSVYQMPKGGLMASAAVTGQKINFQPMQESFDPDDGAVTASGRLSAARSGSGSNQANTSNEASAYQVDQNLQPNDEMKLRTDTSALPSASTRDNGSKDASAYQVDQNLRPSEEIKLQTGNDARDAAHDAARDQNK
jgi:lipid-binding SYLF domain-containing protein